MRRRRHPLRALALSARAASSRAPPHANRLSLPLSLSPRAGAATAGTPGADLCLNVAGPCPATPQGAQTAAYLPGERADVVMLKNLDHFYAAAPGNFSVFLWNATGSA